MSRLGDLENALVSRLAAATIGGQPVFETVRGISGGYRSAIRDGLRRERMPAAYVAFIEEPTSPETKPATRGERFVVLVAARVLRVESDPRHGDIGTIGAFTLLEKAREQLDDYVPQTGLRLVNVHQEFVEADDRAAIYELLYRVWPVVEAPLTFAGQTLTGSASRMALEIGPLEYDYGAFRFPGLDGSYRLLFGLAPRKIVWRGRLRAASNSALNSVEADIDATVASQVEGEVTDGTGRVFGGCVLEKFVREGPRRNSEDGELLVQDVELQFVQWYPA